MGSIVDEVMGNLYPDRIPFVNSYPGFIEADFYRRGITLLYLSEAGEIIIVDAMTAGLQGWAVTARHLDTGPPDMAEIGALYPVFLSSGYGDCVSQDIPETASGNEILLPFRDADAISQMVFQYDAFQFQVLHSGDIEQGRRM